MQHRFQLLALAAVGLMWVLPFLQPYHRFPLTSFYSEWLAFVLGIAALAPLAMKRSWQDMSMPLAALFPLGLICLLLLQAALGRMAYIGQALAPALYLIWAALLIMLGRHLRQKLGMTVVCVGLAWFLLVGGLLGACAAFLQHYQISTVLDAVIVKKTANTVFGNLAQPNHFANYSTLALVSMVFLFALGRLKGVYAALCGMPLLLVLALSGSRSVWIYLAALLALSFWLHRQDAGASGRRALMCAAALLAGFVLAHWVVTLPMFVPEHVPVTTTLQRLFDSLPGPSTRLQLWREAWWMFTEAPVLGGGFGQYAWQRFEFQDLFPGADSHWPQRFNHAHNLIMHLLAETGLAGTLLIVTGAWCWLRGLLRARLDAEHWWLLSLLAVIAIHSMLEFPLWYAYFLGITAIVLGIGETRHLAIGLRRVGHVAVSLVLGAGAINAASALEVYRGLERPFTEGPDTLNVTRLAEVLLLAQRDPLFEPYADYSAAFGITISPGDLEENLALNTRVMRFSPTSDTVYRQALLLAMNRQPADALRELERAARVFPQGLPQTTAKLRDLALKYPEKFTPLLESAVAKAAESRDPPAAR